MSRIFNKIRQSMLAQGRIARYLTYAVGEIVLVVIGILIALHFPRPLEGRACAQFNKFMT